MRLNGVAGTHVSHPVPFFLWSHLRPDFFLKSMDNVKHWVMRASLRRTPTRLVTPSMPSISPESPTSPSSPISRRKRGSIPSISTLQEDTEWPIPKIQLIVNDLAHSGAAKFLRSLGDLTGFIQESIVEIYEMLFSRNAIPRCASAVLFWYLFNKRTESIQSQSCCALWVVHHSW